MVQTAYLLLGNSALQKDVYIVLRELRKLFRHMWFSLVYICNTIETGFSSWNLAKTESQK